MTNFEKLVTDIYDIGIRWMRIKNPDRQKLYGFLFTFFVMYGAMMSVFYIMSVITGIPVFVWSLLTMIVIGCGYIVKNIRTIWKKSRTN